MLANNTQLVVRSSNSAYSNIETYVAAGKKPFISVNVVETVVIDGKPVQVWKTLNAFGDYALKLINLFKITAATPKNDKKRFVIQSRLLRFSLDHILDGGVDLNGGVNEIIIWGDQPENVEDMDAVAPAKTAIELDNIPF